MVRQLLHSMAAFGFLVFSAHAAEEPTQDELDTVVVTGEVPGPGLWKVTKDDHVMWVLASYSPLPKGLTWRTAQMEARITESQEVLYAPYVNIRPEIGMIRGLTLKSAINKAAKLPDGKTLKDVLPAADYAKWSVLRDKYLGTGDYVETRRPATAMRLLRMYALRQHELQGGPDVREEIDDARKKHRVDPVWVPTVRRTIELEDPRGMLESMQELQPAELECFSKELDRVEPEVERLKVLANAWSLGDTETLRSLFRQVTLRDAIREGCIHFALGGAVMSVAPREGASADDDLIGKALEDSLRLDEDAKLQAQLDWLKAAQAALAKNKSTFAVLGLTEMLSQDGHLEKLRALGYMVEEPQ